MKRHLVPVPSDWQPIETAPHDREVMVWTGQGQYVAQWVKSMDTDDEAFSICDLPDGNRMVCKPTHWRPLPEPPA